MKSLSPRAKNILLALAQDEARKIGSSQILPEHIMLSILKLKDGIAYNVFESLALDVEILQKNIEIFLKKESNQPTLDEVPTSRRYKVLMDLAELESTALHNNYIGTEHLLLAAVREEKSVTNSFIVSNDFNIMDIRFSVIKLQEQKKSSILKNQSENLISSIFKSLFDDENLISPLEDENLINENKHEKSKNQKKESFLEEYSRDLTKMARESLSDPVVGRDKEIHRIIQILCRRSKNNPVLTGEPGVGKTAIVEGLAQYIVAGKVPLDLLKKRILSLDLAAIVAGTKYRGEFEERMKKILNELNENKDIILFIDELHSIIGAGGNEGTMDASNIMKPALSRGEIQIIGATTTKEYTRHIERDLALERRFQVVKVEEPSEEETEKILEGIKEKYENYHRVIYENDVIPTIVKLSKRYLPEKVLPDKAIDILDEAGAAKKISEENYPTEIDEIKTNITNLIEEKKKLVQNQDYENAAVVRDKVKDLKECLNAYTNILREHGNNNRKHVTVSDIEKIISEMTEIPVEQMTSSETERIIHMEDELHKTVIGQDEAVNVISGAIRRSRAGISSPKHPLGSFIFLGPTGVGKTQLAKALAKYLFGTEESLIRIDMSDFMEKHTASRLVGAPPGYVGYEEGGILTEKVRRHPYSVVLLDEIEKAHPDIFNLLLQMLEEGELNDNLGHTVNFKNTVIIMTSNAGARQITNEGRVGFGTKEGVLSYDEIKSGALNELKKLLNPELLNRIDDILVFNALSKDEVSKILEIQLKDLSSRLAEKSLSIDITSNAKAYLVERGYNPVFGARPMRKLLRKEIEEPLAMEILSNKDKELDTVCIDCENEQLSIKLVKNEIKSVGVKCLQNYKN